MSSKYEPKFEKKIIHLHLEEGHAYKSITQEYGVSKAAISKNNHTTQKGSNFLLPFRLIYRF